MKETSTAEKIKTGMDEIDAHARENPASDTQIAANSNKAWWTVQTGMEVLDKRYAIKQAQGGAFIEGITPQQLMDVFMIARKSMATKD